MCSQDLRERSEELIRILELFLTESLVEKGYKNARSILKMQLVPNNFEEEIKTKGEIWVRLLGSSVNKQDKANVIGDVHKLRGALLNFDVDKFAKRFGDSQDLDSVKQHVLRFNIEKIRSDTRWESRSHWPQFLKTCISSARFLQRFSSHDDFFRWAGVYCKIKETRAALPLVLANEIYGLGYALACDFLKEIGFLEYGKPDTHTIDILKAFDFCPKDASPYFVQNQMVLIANSLSDDPAEGSLFEQHPTTYALDKLLWLVGSGKFYKHDGSSEEIKLPNQKKNFIDKYVSNFGPTELN